MGRISGRIEFLWLIDGSVKALKYPEKNDAHQISTIRLKRTSWK